MPKPTKRTRPTKPNRPYKQKWPKAYAVYCFIQRDLSKIYIGMTNSLHSRAMTHMQKLARGRHINPKLQADYAAGYRFKFKVIKAGLTQEQAAKLEHEWIHMQLDAAPDLLYNIKTSKGIGAKNVRTANAIECEWNGTLYPSISEAARVAGVSAQAMRYRHLRGITSDSQLNSSRSSYKVLYANRLYKSMTHLCRTANMSETTAYALLKQGLVVKVYV